jgi:hypothetical protein
VEAVEAVAEVLFAAPSARVRVCVRARASERRPRDGCSCGQSWPTGPVPSRAVSLAAKARRPLRRGAWREDELRNLRLLLDSEPPADARSAPGLGLGSGGSVPAAVRRAARVRPVPPRPVRLVEQLLYKLGRLSGERAIIGVPPAARLALAGRGGEAGETRARILLRVDEFPHFEAWDRPERYGSEHFLRFHEILALAGVPYLLAVSPRVSRLPLSPAENASRGLMSGETELLAGLTGQRVCFALHGRDHRTRFASPRRRSELCGLSRAQTCTLIDAALAELAPHGVVPDVFVPPYNRFDARQLPWLAQRFAVVCGGPESIGTLGFQRTPQWRGEAVYLPSYAPLYGRAADVLAALPRILSAAPEGPRWLPVVLHWGWEADAGWRALEQLAAFLAGHAAPWDDFLAAVARSRDGTPGPPP